MNEATYHRVVCTPHARGTWITFPKRECGDNTEFKNQQFFEKNLEEKPLTKNEKTLYE